MRTAKTALCCILLFGFVFAAATPILAQETGEVDGEQLPEEARRFMEFVGSLNWVQGPAELKVGPHAVVMVPEGMVGLDSKQARDYVERLGNLRGEQLALVANPDLSWFVDFSFDDVGYVEDDEKDDIDADELMKAMLEGQKQANRKRQSLGLPALQNKGWAEKPHYDENLRALTWAVKITDGGEETSINHNVRILGRRGVMDATLVCAEEGYAAAKTSATQVVKAFRYQEGERYGDFRKGDKIAEYGLKGLILGGGLALAAKTGLLSKLWKFLVIGFLAVVGFIKKLFGRGGSSDSGGRRGGSRTRSTPAK
ncbi:MAG: DUF2167 domain-containing protein [Planctomycetes bacterium]|nr:DUF2167 domain-containing protein [Planctomycetota bacterium]